MAELVEKIPMSDMLKSVSKMPGALRTIANSGKASNIGRLTGGISKMNKARKVKKAAKVGGKVALKAAKAGVMEAGEMGAVETGGASILIAAGVSFAGKLIAKQKQAESMSRAFGNTETFGAIQIVAFKRALADNVKLHIKRVGMASLIKGVAQNKSLKWQEKGYLNPRQREILNTASETKKIWKFADESRKRPK
ncbi:MAG: hypothetical protein ACK5LM_07965 [Lactovum sp.]